MLDSNPILMYILSPLKKKKVIPACHQPPQQLRKIDRQMITKEHYKKRLVQSPGKWKVRSMYSTARPNPLILEADWIFSVLLQHTSVPQCLAKSAESSMSFCDSQKLNSLK